jgi:hypothetical protein
MDGGWGGRLNGFGVDMWWGWGDEDELFKGGSLRSRVQPFVIILSVMEGVWTGMEEGGDIISAGVGCLGECGSEDQESRGQGLD